MKPVVVVALFLLACQSDAGPVDRSGPLPPTPSEIVQPLRTYGEVQANLAHDLFLDGNPYPLSLLATLAQTPEQAFAFLALESLLGTYTVDQVTGVIRFEPVVANPVNMFLWNMMFRRLGQLFATVCTRNSPFLDFATLQAGAFVDLQEACDWPHPHAKLALQRLWTRVLGHRAPRNELTIWLDHFGKNGSPYLSEPATVVIQDAVHSMLMSPYFLLAE